MAISGKRFQITDGASTPTNLFPYTVTEAVYGLSTLLANTQSAAVNEAAESAASLYLPLSGGSSKPMTGAIYVPSNVSALTVVGSSSSILFGVADSQSHFGQTAGTTYLRSGNTNLQHNKAGTNYAILDASNFRAGTEYVSISGTETITGVKTFTGAIMGIKYDNPRIGFYTAGGTLNGMYAFRSLGVPEIYHPTDGWKTLYHSGNSNTGYPWGCTTLTASDHVYMANAKSLYWKTSGTSAAYYTVLSMSSSNEIILGYGASLQGIPTKIFGNAVSLYYGTTGSALGLILNSSGNVGIGNVSSPSQKLHIAGSEYVAGGFVRIDAGQNYGVIYGGYHYSIAEVDSSGNNRFGQGRSGLVLPTYIFGNGITFYNSSRGTVASISNSGVFTTAGDQVISSDAALKKNWREVGYGIEEIANCTVGRFDWKDGHGTSVGSKAQDWLPLVPELVHGEEGNMTLAYGQIALVNSILLAKHETEQDKEIRKLKEKVRDLEKQLNIS